jgi:H+/Cl- antiporter ClcA
MSNTLETQDLFRMAKNFHGLAKYVGDYMYENWDDISEESRKSLDHQAMVLLTISSQLNSKALMQNIDLLDDEAEAIKAGIKKIKETIDNVNDVKKLIDIAAKVIAFGIAIGAGVSTGNLGVAVPAAVALAQEVGD